MKPGRGIAAPPPQARPPQTGGPLIAQTPRQAQRQQYLQNHPNARGNQPQQPMAQALPQRPPQGQPLQPMRPGQQMPQFNPMQMPGRGGGYGMNGMAQAVGGQQMGQWLGGQMNGAPIQNLPHRFSPGQRPDMQNYMQGADPYQRQNPVLNDPNMQWQKLKGGY